MRRLLLINILALKWLSMIKEDLSPTVHRSMFRVYTEDTDLMGIVYHANYLCFFERARTDMLRDYGLSLTMMSRYDTSFAIREIQMSYFHPARLDDELIIETLGRREKKCSLMFNQKMHNSLGSLLCEATIKVVCVDSKLKPKPLPEDFFLKN